MHMDAWRDWIKARLQADVRMTERSHASLPCQHVRARLSRDLLQCLCAYKRTRLLNASRCLSCAARRRLRGVTISDSAPPRS